MRVDIISIFPEYFAPLDVSLIGKARERGILDIRLHQLRDWAHDVHRTVDDTPYGGGPGMVMKPEPVGRGHRRGHRRRPAAAPGWSCRRRAGVPFTQELAMESPRSPGCCSPAAATRASTPGSWPSTARACASTRSSIGDYVLAGGEVAVLVMVEAVGTAAARACSATPTRPSTTPSRPGAMENLLEGPVYTKPPEWRGHEVPEILLSGHHGKIARWRRDEALRRTVANRPELLAALDPESLDKHDRRVLAELGLPGPDLPVGRHGVTGGERQPGPRSGSLRRGSRGVRRVDFSLPRRYGRLKRCRRSFTGRRACR